MAGPVDLDHRLRSAAGPQPDIERALADVLQRIRRRTRRTVVAAATVVAVVGALVAVWVVDGPGSERSPVMVGVPTSPATSETSPSNERPSEVGRRPLAEEQVVARGEVDGEQWRLKAQPFENGIICLELSGGGCGVIPTDEGPLGAVFHTADSIEGSRFVFGAVIVEAAEVTLELANGEELSVTASPPTFGFRFYAIPVPAGPDAVAVTARDPAGVELERVDLA